MNLPDKYEEMASKLDREASEERFPKSQNGKFNSDGATKREVIFLCGKDLNPEPVSWLWQDWLAKGKLHILAGAPGQGKTTLALTLGAIVTSGGKWPDGWPCYSGNILIWSGEDDAADTLLPRLLAAGADKNKCYFITGTRVNGEISSFDPSRDLLDLELEANRVGGISLIIIDPIVSAVTGDSYKNTEVRRDLQPVVDLGSRLNAAVLGISHFSKGGAGSDPAMRVVGSVAFTAVARIVLVAAKVKSNEGEQERRIFARAKSNIGPDDGGFEYFIDQMEPLPGISASRITWGQSLSGTAKDLLTDPEQEMDEGDDCKNAVEQAMNFLEQALSDGIAPSKTIQKEAKDSGIAPRTLRRASQKLNVVCKKGAGGIWYWRLPYDTSDEPVELQVVETANNMAKQDDHVVQFQKHGQHGHVDQEAIGTSNDHANLNIHVGQVGQDLNVGQVGHLDGQVALDDGDGEII